MSIHSNMQKYELQKKVKVGYEPTNKPKYEYQKVTDIEVSISFVAINKRSEDIRFKDCEYSGLTEYKDVSVSDEYRIVSQDGTKYVVKSINTLTRLSQMLLQVVV